MSHFHPPTSFSGEAQAKSFSDFPKWFGFVPQQRKVSDFSPGPVITVSLFHQASGCRAALKNKTSEILPLSQCLAWQRRSLRSTWPSTEFEGVVATIPWEGTQKGFFSRGPATPSGPTVDSCFLRSSCAKTFLSWLLCLSLGPSLTKHRLCFSFLWWRRPVATIIRSEKTLLSLPSSLGTSTSLFKYLLLCAMCSSQHSLCFPSLKWMRQSSFWSS